MKRADSDMAVDRAQSGWACLCSVSNTRRPKAVLKMRINESDRNDAAGVARIMQTAPSYRCSKSMISIVRF